MNLEGVADFTQIHDFDGSPSQGTWVVEVRDIVPGVAESIWELSIAPLYAPAGKIPLPLTKDDGKITSARIAEGAVKGTERPETKLKQAAIIQPEPQLDI